MSEQVKLRPALKTFAEAMELVLRKNDHKGGWKSEAVGYLLGRIGDELEEAKEVYNGVHDGDALRKMQKEVVDIANFSMMLYDNLEDYYNDDD